MNRRIDETTAEYLGEGATLLDVQAFHAACWNYLRANHCTEDEAIAAIWGDGDFWKRVYEWAPEMAARADRDADDLSR